MNAFQVLKWLNHIKFTDLFNVHVYHEQSDVPKDCIIAEIIWVYICMYRKMLLPKPQRDDEEDYYNITVHEKPIYCTNLSISSSKASEADLIETLWK